MAEHTQKLKYAVQNEDGTPVRRGFRTYLEVEQSVKTDNEEIASPQMTQSINIITSISAEDKQHNATSLTGALNGIIELFGGTEADLPKLLTRMLIKVALDKCGGVQNEAARLLGISPRTMNYWTKVKECNNLQITDLPMNPIKLIEGGY